MTLSLFHVDAFTEKPFSCKRLGKSEFVAYQASARGGIVWVRVSDKRAYLGGKAVTVSKGELLA